MSQFLLPCSCGAKIPVSRSQAGMSLPCPTCGKSLDVPTIRTINQLEPIEEPTASRRSQDTNKPSFLLRIATGVFFLVALGCLGYGGLMAYDRITFPDPLDKTEEVFLSEAEQRLSEMTPAGTWDMWNFMADVGLSEVTTPDYFLYKRAFDQTRPKMIAYLSVGGLSLLAFIFCALSSRKRS